MIENVKEREDVKTNYMYHPYYLNYLCYPDNTYHTYLISVNPSLSSGKMERGCVVREMVLHTVAYAVACSLQSSDVALVEVVGIVRVADAGGVVE